MIPRKLFTYSATFLLGVLTTIYFVSEPDEIDNAATPENIAAFDWGNLHQRNLQLEHENNQLKIKLQNLEADFSTTKANNPLSTKVIPENTSTTTSSQPQLITFQEYEQAKKFSDWIINSVKNSGDINREAAMGFLAEPVDAQWAGQQESSLRTTLTNDEGMGNFALKDVQCRTSLCQVSFAINSVEEAETITSETRRALESLSRHVAIISAPDPDKSVTHMYVSLDEKGFAFIP